MEEDASERWGGKGLLVGTGSDLVVEDVRQSVFFGLRGARFW